MILKKHKAVIAAVLSAAMAASAVMPMTVSAAGSRTKDEAFGDETYADRFLSLYDDVITNGGANGYLSDGNAPSGGFGVPYHSVEEVCVEAPDYGHETTSEAMSYIVWMAAMRDNIVNKTGKGGSVGDLAKAWKTLEVMIPTMQKGMMTQETPSATLSLEWDEPEAYTGDAIKMYQGNTGVNPIHPYFVKAYSGDTGLYLLHWLADVDDWYGYGGSARGEKGKFTFINTFQRGSQESVFETVPHPSVEELTYGGSKGIKGIFKTAEEDVPAQWSYTNAPDAEDRAIQAVYAANRWGVGDDSVTALAGKMGDQLRNNMFDKYYKPIGTTDFNTAQDTSDKYSGAHFLMSWYTSWGGAIDGMWTWQIGASHCHEFYQNPLAAFALLQDSGLSKAMKAQDAKKDYEKSLQRQMEFYLWLQSADGPIAGGATSSWRGRYGYESGKTPPTGSTFYKMDYVEHPVYEDPGSNHWIGNQVWAVQRLAEMYYVIKTEGDKTGIKAGGLSLEDALKAILDRWVEWFVNNTKLYEDDTFEIPSTLDWSGAPESWNGKYDPNANSGLTCTITAMGSSDLGCVSSLCNSLIYYAKATDTPAIAATVENNDTLGGKALYLAHKLLDSEWEQGRDDIGLTMDEYNGSLKRIFEQEVFIPTYYSGTTPYGDKLENGVKFIDFRSQYRDSDMFNALESEYKASGSTEDFKLNYHRFWHAGDILLALGTMYEMYGDEVLPDSESHQQQTTTVPTEDPADSVKVEPGSITVEVGESEKITVTVDGNPVDAEFSTTKEDVVSVSPDGTVTGVAPGSATVMINVDVNGTTVDKAVSVTVKKPDATTEPTTKPTTPQTTKDPNADALWGDANDDKIVNVADVVSLNLYLLNNDENPLGNGTGSESEARGSRNADVTHDGAIKAEDGTLIMNYVAELITIDKLAP